MKAGVFDVIVCSMLLVLEQYGESLYATIVLSIWCNAYKEFYKFQNYRKMDAIW